MSCARTLSPGAQDSPEVDIESDRCLANIVGTAYVSARAVWTTWRPRSPRGKRPMEF
jgi:hypothetical protein